MTDGESQQSFTVMGNLGNMPPMLVYPPPDDLASKIPLSHTPILSPSTPQAKGEFEMSLPQYEGKVGSLASLEPGYSFRLSSSGGSLIVLSHPRTLKGKGYQTDCHTYVTWDSSFVDLYRLVAS